MRMILTSFNEMVIVDIVCMHTLECCVREGRWICGVSFLRCCRIVRGVLRVTKTPRCGWFQADRQFFLQCRTRSLFLRFDDVLFFMLYLKSYLSIKQLVNFEGVLCESAWELVFFWTSESFSSHFFNLWDHVRAYFIRFALLWHESTKLARCNIWASQECCEGYLDSDLRFLFWWQGDLGKSKAFWVTKDMLAWDTKSESSQVYLHSSNHAKLQLTAKGVDGKRLNSFADRRVGIDVVPVHSIEYMKISRSRY